MIYLGNGIYSDSGPDTLSHYGVLGMKWGIHRARQHEKNIRTYNRYHGMTRKQANAEYKKRMADLELYAKKHKGNKRYTSDDIANVSRKYAQKKIKDYDNKRKLQKFDRAMTGISAGATLGLLGMATGSALKGDVKQLKFAAKNPGARAATAEIVGRDIRQNLQNAGYHNLAIPAATTGLNAGLTSYSNKYMFGKHSNEYLDGEKNKRKKK